MNDSELVKIIRSTTEKISSKDEIQLLGRVDALIRDAHHEYKQSDEKSLEFINQLERKLEISRAAVENPSNPGQLQDATDKLKSLDDTKISLVKEINELESKIEKYSSRIQELTDQKSMLASQYESEQNTNIVDHQTKLKLQIYNDLGIVLDEQKNVALVQSSSHDAVHLLHLDSPNLSEQIWDKI